MQAGPFPLHEGRRSWSCEGRWLHALVLALRQGLNRTKAQRERRWKLDGARTVANHEGMALATLQRHLKEATLAQRRARTLARKGRCTDARVALMDARTALRKARWEARSLGSFGPVRAVELGVRATAVSVRRCKRN